MNEIANIISTVGFPISSFLITVYFIKYMYDKQLEKDRVAWEKVSELTLAVNNNTEALRDLVQSMMNKE